MLSAVRKAETRWVIDPASPQWGRNWKVFSPRSLWTTQVGNMTSINLNLFITKISILSYFPMIVSIQNKQSTDGRINTGKLYNRVENTLFSMWALPLNGNCMCVKKPSFSLTSSGCWAPWCCHTCRRCSSCMEGCHVWSTVLASDSYKRTCGCCVWFRHLRCQSLKPAKNKPVNATSSFS